MPCDAQRKGDAPRLSLQDQAHETEGHDDWQPNTTCRDRPDQRASSDSSGHESEQGKPCHSQQHIS